MVVCQRGGDEQQLPGWAPRLCPFGVLAGRRQRGRSPGDLGVTQGWLLITLTLSLWLSCASQVSLPGEGACKLKQAPACTLLALVLQQLPSSRSKPGHSQPPSGRALITEQGETLGLTSFAVAPWLEKMLSSQLTVGLLKGREELMVFFKSRLL